jgi:hypothetical protein
LEIGRAHFSPMLTEGCSSVKPENDRLWFGFWPQFLNPRRLLRAAIVVRPATLLRCHRRLKALKRQFRYSSHPKGKPGAFARSPSGLWTTLGNVIAMACSNYQSPLEGRQVHCHGLVQLPIAA